MMRVYYIYRHIRLDKNIPFYIGKGVTTPNAKSYKWEYRRAFYGTEARNNHWKSITSISDYEVEIIFETTDQNIIDQKEKEFIKLYGRKGVGTLCNQTDGGDGWSNPPEDIIRKAVNKRIENGTYEKCKISNSRPVFMYDINGKFIKKYNSIRHLKSETFIDATTVWEYVKNKKSIYNCLLSYEFYINGIDVSSFTIANFKSNPILVSDKYNTPLSIYKSAEKLAIALKGSTTGMARAIKENILYKDYYLKYLEIYELINYKNNHGIHINR